LRFRIRELLESSSRQGETVLDLFAGVASTGVVTVLCGRKSILCESDERWIHGGAAAPLVASA